MTLKIKIDKNESDNLKAIYIILFLENKNVYEEY